MIPRFDSMAVALAACAIGFVIMVGFSWRKESRLQRVTAEYAQYRADTEAAARIANQNALKDLQAQATIFEEIQKNARQKTERDAATLADLRARYDRLRIKANSPARCPAVPEATDSRQPDGPAPGGVISGSDEGASGADFIDLAEDAESVRTRLISCQAVLEALK